MMRSRSFLLVTLLTVVTVASANSHVGTSKSRLDRAALKKLVDDARKSRSNALLVWADGKMIVEDYFGGHPHLEMLMSCTKSIVAIAVGKLVEEHKVKLDQPVSDFYPEWKQGQKSKITVRMLLDGTSGLQSAMETGSEIYPAPDAVRLALAAEITDPPGSTFRYNNKAINLVAGIVQLASGLPLDRYVDDKVMSPLGIDDAKWAEFDRAGNPYAMSGALMRPEALVRIGRMMLDGGVLDGKRVLDSSTVRGLTDPSKSPTYGLAWWRLPAWQYAVIDDARLAALKKAGVDASFIAAMTKLKDRHMEGNAAFIAAVKSVLGEKWQDTYATVRARTRIVDEHVSPDAIGYYAEGFLGEYLVVIPKHRLVVVRMIDPDDAHTDADDFDELYDDVRALAR